MGLEHLRALAGTWIGVNELWLDPDLDPEASAGTLTIEAHRIRDTWAYERAPKHGVYRLVERAGRIDALWYDSWHQTRTMTCRGVAGENPLLDVTGVYPTPEGPPWRWRTILSMRSDGHLVLQMKNVCPWGEEQRAVRMILTPAPQ